MKTLLATLKLLGAIIAVALMALGAWIVGALIMHVDLPLWAGGLGAASVALLLPMFWDWSAAASFEQRAKKRQEKGKPAPWRPAFASRLLTRAALFNVVTLFALWIFAHERVEQALADRADWMIQDRHDAASERARSGLRSLAGMIGAEQKRLRAQAPSLVHKLIDPQQLSSNALWPVAPTVHPLALELKDAPSIEALGKALEQREPSQAQRARALHDWVATHIAYEVSALNAKTSPKPEVAQLFKARAATSAGYAKLVQAIGQAAGLKVAYIEGLARSLDGALGANAHAWNAVELDGAWYLMDVTWDAGVVRDGAYIAQHRTDYLFTPATIFGVEHLPDDPSWQLVPKPLDQAAFLQQPALRPTFFAAGLKLVSPTKQDISAQDALMVTLENPQGHKLIAQLATEPGFSGQRCQTQGDSSAEVTFVCPIKAQGPIWFQLFYAQGAGRFVYVGQHRAQGQP